VSAQISKKMKIAAHKLAKIQCNIIYHHAEFPIHTLHSIVHKIWRASESTQIPLDDRFVSLHIQFIPILARMFVIFFEK